VSDEILSRASAHLAVLQDALRRGQSEEGAVLARTLAETAGCPPALAALAVGQVLRDTEEIQRPTLAPILAAWRFLRPTAQEQGWLVTGSDKLRETVEQLNHEAQNSSIADKFLASVGLADGGYWLKQAQDGDRVLAESLDSGRGLPPSRFALITRTGSRWRALVAVTARPGQLTLSARDSSQMPLVQSCARSVADQCDTAIVVEDLG